MEAEDRKNKKGDGGEAFLSSLILCAGYLTWADVAFTPLISALHSEPITSSTFS